MDSDNIQKLHFLKICMQPDSNENQRFDPII